ncbi:MAG: hypothetical protein O7G30_16135 [Proteobacteria bacterium]|nr:hypothetical protein [Pseudomonadota bacterium]
MDSEPLSTLEKPQGADQPIAADPSGAADTERRSWVQRVRARLLTSELEEESFSPSEEMPTWEDWRDYLSLVTWLVPDVYRHARLKTLGVVLLSVLGVGARAATIGSLLLYVHAQNAGETVTLLGFALPSDTTPAVLLLWGGVALLFAVATIAASYSADVLIFRVARRYVEDSTARVMRHVAGGGEVAPLETDPQGSRDRPIMQMLVGDTFRLTRVVIQTLSILVPIITLVAAAGILISIHPVLSAILIPVIAVYTYLLGILNRGVMRDSQRREFTRRIHSRDVSKMLRTLDRTRYGANARPAWLSSYPAESWMDLNMQAFRGIVLAKRRVDYLGDAFQGVSLLIVLMAFGTIIATQGTSWAVLLTYLITLGYGIRSMGRVSKCVTTANRFLPQVRRYVAFMRDNPDLGVETERIELADPLRFPVSEPSLPGSAPWIDAVPGEPVLCILPGTIKSRKLGELCTVLAGEDPRRATALESQLFFLRRGGALPERPLRQHLPRGFTDEPESRIAELLKRMGVGDEYGEKLGGLDTVLSVRLDEALSPALSYALRLLPGLLSDQRVFVLDWESLDQLGELVRDRILSELSNRVVLLVPRLAPKELPHGIRHVLCADAEAVRGVGNPEWYARMVREGLIEVSDEKEDQTEPGLPESQAALDDEDEDFE